LWIGWKRVLIGLVLSSFVGFVAGALFLVVLSRISKRGGVRTSGVFRWLQIGSAAFVAFSHGSNDGQKFMGTFTLALVLGGVLTTFVIPSWVIVLCAIVMASGTMVGGKRIAATLGQRLTALEPRDGFAAETAAATTITLASRYGIPLSTTHTIATAIMGVGTVRDVRGVDWGVAKNLALAWLVTFPICGALSWTVVKGLTVLPHALAFVVAGLIVAFALATTLRSRRRLKRNDDSLVDPTIPPGHPPPHGAHSADA
jgi:PiT family inorganic phosphate transporter